MSEVSEGSVMTAVYDLHKRTDDWPTPEGIAAHLGVHVNDVRDHLLSLRRRKLFRMRQRQGKRVWMPWSAT